jgi:DNA-binding MarR family transcriptional regulator
LADWSLLTNHGRLLLAIENEPGLRVRDLADRLELSERGWVVRDLREAGYVTPRSPKPRHPGGSEPEGQALSRGASV